MKKSELKEMIKSAFLAELNTDAQYEDEGAYDFMGETEEEEKKVIVDPYMAEAKDDEDVKVKVKVDAAEDEDTDVVDTADTDISADDEEVEGNNDSIVIDKKIVSLSSLPQEKRKILDTLETLRGQAEEFGDQKFMTQVGNTITFFTRDFIVSDDKPDSRGIEESAADNLELKNVAKQLYLGFKKMGADVELSKPGKVVLNKRPADGNMDSKDVFLYSEDDRVIANLVGDKAIGFYDKIQKGFPQFEFLDGGDNETWNGAKIKTLIILPGKTTSESLNESVFPMWNKIK